MSQIQILKLTIAILGLIVLLFTAQHIFPRPVGLKNQAAPTANATSVETAQTKATAPAQVPQPQANTQSSGAPTNTETVTPQVQKPIQIRNDDGVGDD